MKKKLLAALLASVMALSVTACGDTGSEAGGSETGSSSSQTQASGGAEESKESSDAAPAEREEKTVSAFVMQSVTGESGIWQGWGTTSPTCAQKRTPCWRRGILRTLPGVWRALCRSTWMPNRKEAAGRTLGGSACGCLIAAGMAGSGGCAAGRWGWRTPANPCCWGLRCFQQRQ